MADSLPSILVLNCHYRLFSTISWKEPTGSSLYCGLCSKHFLQSGPVCTLDGTLNSFGRYFLIRCLAVASICSVIYSASPFPSIVNYVQLSLIMHSLLSNACSAGLILIQRFNVTFDGKNKKWDLKSKPYIYLSCNFAGSCWMLYFTVSCDFGYHGNRC